MIKNLSKSLIILGVAGAISGCKLGVIVVEGGGVQSASGTRNCSEGDNCVFQVTDTRFSESFTAVPRAGYEFSNWNAGNNFQCADSTNPTCVISTTGLAGNAAAEAVIASEKMFYIMPVFEFVGIDTDGDGIPDHIDEDDDNDGIFDVDDPYPLDPELPGEATVLTGIYMEDIYLTAEAGPYLIKTPMEVGNGATIHVQEGTKIVGDAASGECASVEIFHGNLIATGTPTSPIEVESTCFHFEAIGGIYETLVVHVENVRLLSASRMGVNEGYGSERRSAYRRAHYIDNYVDESSSLSLSTQSADYIVSGNEFHGASCGANGPSLIYRSNKCYSEYAGFNGNYYIDANVTVELNTFVNTEVRIGAAVKFRNNLVTGQRARVQGGGGDVLIENNTFDLYGEGVVVGLCSLANNYWSTVDTSTMDRLIYDRNDSLAQGCYIDYQPILEMAHPDTPSL